MRKNAACPSVAPDGERASRRRLLGSALALASAPLLACGGGSSGPSTQATRG
jgi:hypothetical protein